MVMVMVMVVMVMVGKRQGRARRVKREGSKDNDDHQTITSTVSILYTKVVIIRVVIRCGLESGQG